MVKSTSKKDERKGSEKGSERLDPSNRGVTSTEAVEAKGLVGFLRSTRQELDKVVWPSRRQLISESVAVLLIVLVFAAFVYLIDQAFAWAAQQIFR